MKSTLLLASALGAAAFPSFKEGRDVTMNIRTVLNNVERRSLEARQQDALGISRSESNCGTRLCPTFDGEGSIPSTNALKLSC